MTSPIVRKLARDKGVDLVNIAQPFKKAGMQLVCPKDGPIKTEADFKGKTLGVWFFGNEFPFLSWMNHLGLKTDGGPEGVTVLKQGFNVDPLLQKQAACISTMTYNEYGQVLDAGLKPEDLVTFKYEDQGVATLEDGLYALEETLADPAMAGHGGESLLAVASRAARGGCTFTVSAATGTFCGATQDRSASRLACVHAMQPVNRSHCRSQ